MREEKIFFLPSSVQVPRRQDMSFAYFVFSGKHKITLQNYHKLEMFQKKKLLLFPIDFQTPSQESGASFFLTR